MMNFQQQLPFLFAFAALMLQTAGLCCWDHGHRHQTAETVEADTVPVAQTHSGCGHTHTHTPPVSEDSEEGPAAPLHHHCECLGVCFTIPAKAVAAPDQPSGITTVWPSDSETVSESLLLTVRSRSSAVEAMRNVSAQPLCALHQIWLL